MKLIISHDDEDNFYILQGGNLERKAAKLFEEERTVLQLDIVPWQQGYREGDKELTLTNYEASLMQQVLLYFVMGNTVNAVDETPIFKMGDEGLLPDLVALYDKNYATIGPASTIDEGLEICAWYEEGDGEPPGYGEDAKKPISPIFVDGGHRGEQECFDWIEKVKPPFKCNMWAHYGRGWMCGGPSSPNRHKWQWDGKNFSGPIQDEKYRKDPQ